VQLSSVPLQAVCRGLSAVNKACGQGAVDPTFSKLCPRCPTRGCASTPPKQGALSRIARRPWLFCFGAASMLVSAALLQNPRPMPLHRLLQPQPTYSPALRICDRDPGTLAAGPRGGCAGIRISEMIGPSLHLSTSQVPFRGRSLLWIYEVCFHSIKAYIQPSRDLGVVTLH
jgi:hypothetical protein